MGRIGVKVPRVSEMTSSRSTMALTAEVKSLCVLDSRYTPADALVYIIYIIHIIHGHRQREGEIQTETQTQTQTDRHARTHSIIDYMLLLVMSVVLANCL